MRVWTGALAVFGSALLPSFPNSLLCGNSILFRKIVHAGIALSVSCRKRWTAEFTEAHEGLRASDGCTYCIKAAFPLPLQDFVVDLRERLRAVWRVLDGADPRTLAHKLATYHAWMASSLKLSTA